MKTIMIASLIVASVSLMAVGSVSANEFELNSLSVPMQQRGIESITREQKDIHFSFAESGEVWQNNQSAEVALESNEYWFQISGAELKSGIDLDISEPEPLVRFSSLTLPDARQSLGGNQTGLPSIQPGLVSKQPGLSEIPRPQGSRRANAINPDQLEIFREGEVQPMNAAKLNMINETQLASDSIFQRSGAMKLNASIGTGRFKMRTRQSLRDSDQYLINIKEKGSQKKLHMSAPRLSLLSGEAITFGAQMKDRHRVLSGADYQAYVVSPDGETSWVKLREGKKGQWQVDMPSRFGHTRPGELHELYIDAYAPEGNNQLRRSGKIAFSVATPTAQLEDIKLVMEDDTLADSMINVASEGRYELRATLYGTDENGEMRSIMRSHSAYWLTPGLQQVALKLDQKIFENSGLSAPFALKSFELIDQSQLGVLHRQSEI
ncbi:DUF4785 domain-containing protein [Endozoicomonas numazuensis]|uniref:DUF4785 domain-containing protein n=1 Tax=Endozoicomonas numazuensis TaxID=1137799 RepID=A0A081NLY0_9GAMM|nr:DUF4785 domain-containing protein [Endozoicomonas numazuensis]KEQ19453.1 hypothetical protein GZ78_05815 [Endozoicomonas numazuensis]